MAHLSSFGVGNFRSFRDMAQFHFRPVTILTGANSSGKSSLTKALLLLKEAFKKMQPYNRNLANAGRWSLYPLMKLQFNPKLYLGNFDTAHNYLSREESMDFVLPFKLPNCNRELNLKLSYVVDEGQLKNGRMDSLELCEGLKSEILIKISRNKKGYEEYFNYPALWDLVAQSKDKYEFIKGLMEKLKTEINLYGLSQEALKHREGWPQTVVDLVEQIEKLEKEYPSQEYSEYSDTSTLASKFMYWQEVSPLDEFGKPTEFRYFYNTTLLNYLFLYEPDEVHLKSVEKWYPGLSQESIEELLIDYHAARMEIQKHQREGESFFEVIRKWEFEALSVLNNLQCEVSNQEEMDFSEPFMAIKNMLSQDYQDEEGKFSLSRSEEKTRSSFLAKRISNSETPLRKILKNPYLIMDKVEGVESFPDISCGGFFLKTFLYEGVGSMLKNLSSIFSKIEYVPSVRTKVDRFFRNAPEESFLHECLEVFLNTKVEEEALRFFECYVRYFDIADRVDLVPSQDSTLTNIVLTKGNQKIQLADVGYGFSQLIPVLLKIALLISKNTRYDYLERDFNTGDYEAQPNGTYHPSILIIEEPETNLHPSLQSKLADMFIECYQKYNIQLILETHSEYMIRRLQRRTAEFDNEKKKDHFSVPMDFGRIYYFHNPGNIPEGEKQVYRIDLEKDGSLTKNFGRGFFDEASTEDLLLYQTAKHHNN